MGNVPDMKELATATFLRTLQAVDAERAVRGLIHRRGDVLGIGDLSFKMTDLDGVVLIAFGKAAIKMALGFMGGAQLPSLIGVVATNQTADPDSAKRLREAGLEVFRSGHPVPDSQSVAAATRILRLLGMTKEGWLVVFLISGGGSAIVEKPIDESISLDDLRSLNHLLVTSGAAIAEMNVVRKHFSAIKGGRLSAATACRNQVSLYISDTNAGDLPSIASGPTIPDESTWEQVRAIIARHRLDTQLPNSIRETLAGGLIETPKSNQLMFDASRHLVVLSNSDAVAAAARLAEEQGLRATIVEDLVEGDYRQIASEHLARLQRLSTGHRDVTTCLISGGEVSCKVRGPGIGGRNQEFVLYSATIATEELRGRNWVALSAGTDGIDGNSPATGAVADSTTLMRANTLNLDPAEFLERSDSYNFFRQLGDAIITGSTGSNVRDLRIFMARKMDG